MHIPRYKGSSPATSICPHSGKRMWHKASGTVEYNEKQWLAETLKPSVKIKK